jgi:hypothetical protein
MAVLLFTAAVSKPGPDGSGSLITVIEVNVRKIPSLCISDVMLGRVVKFTASVVKLTLSEEKQITILVACNTNAEIIHFLEADDRLLGLW